MEEGLFPHSRAATSDDEVEEERRLCYVCITRARERLILTAARRRRVFGEYQPTTPSRFLNEIPGELVERTELAASRREPQAYVLRNPYGRHGRGSRSREDSPGYAYESEDQSQTGVRAGMRVRHRQFGVGTIIDVEDQGDDYKLTVRFSAVGTKKLLARFANLEPA
jgi:DNA helicase-2/ATP-dependent DNA helicase PcrA